MPLGDASPTEPFAVMLNILGQNDSNDYGLSDREVGGASVHIYGKAPRAGRKMGHITALSNESLAEARQIATEVWKGLQA
jgi:5-(carboxyamino)imidazole ribonucleotide synthase